MALIEDIEMKIINDYHEYTKMAGSDFRICSDLKALWQAFEGELKTKQGTCYGVGLRNYGSRLHEFLGENMNEFTENEIIFVVEEVAKKYIEIRKISIDFKTIKYNRGQISMDITLHPIFGPYLNTFTYNTGCDD
jgi:phage baseplate assembly protein W